MKNAFETNEPSNRIEKCLLTLPETREFEWPRILEGDYISGEH
jgi:hypothetical protein